MRIFYGNFEFEHALCEAVPRSLAEKLRRINLEIGAALAALADDGDFIWLPEQVETGFSDKLAAAGLPEVRFAREEIDVPNSPELVPWGWTTPLRDWAKRQGWQCIAPAQATVERINSRKFSFELEQEWGCSLDGAAEIHSLDQLAEKLAQQPNDGNGWVLKSEFSMSARERIIGRTTELTAPARNWTTSRLATGMSLFFEPWVERVEEAGLQFTIPEAGPPLLVGITPLLCDALGQYRGSRFGDDPALRLRWNEAIAIGLKAAERAQSHGYFGPMGIDAMHYRDSAGKERVRPLQDINGRMTMGRVSLGLRRLLQPGEVGSWLHLRCPAKDEEQAARWYDELRKMLPTSVRTVRTSPLTVGGLPVQHATIATISSDTTSLHDAEQRLLKH
ncbi:MAG: hypothetical protein AB7O26_01780 [Planctomycetaceae bacterium]